MRALPPGADKPNERRTNGNGGETGPATALHTAFMMTYL